MSDVKRLSLSDIPLEILESEYQIWSKAIEGGWKNRLWKRCELCEYCDKYIGEKYNGCEICPLPPTFFCCGDSKRSVLHIDSHDSESEWKQTVDAFLKFLGREINKRRYE